MSAVLVLVDVQKEYIDPNSPFCLDHIEPALQNLRKLQEYGREKGWTIIHVKHQQGAEVFAYDSPSSEFIDGFEAIGDEKVMVKHNFSCFSSAEFKAFIDHYRNRDIILAGFSAAMCCLSTLIEAHHRGYEFIYVADATAARRTEHFDEQTMKECVVDIAKAYAHIVTTEDILKS